LSRITSGCNRRERRGWDGLRYAPAAPKPSVMVTKMRSLSILIVLYLFSSSLYADAFNCHGESFNERQFGDFGSIEYGEPIAFEAILQSSLKNLSKEAELMSRVKPLHSEEESYIHDAIDLLEGRNTIYSCFAKRLKPKDIILNFKERGGSETRTGFVIMRSNKPVAYFYESVVNI
ncbi:MULTISPECIES: hypothetical protein, partial [Microbulbifer]|uniref:hypothetical protein n=1 Tax=Microbulbifer TaxID=48073 RepID=UPI000B01B567